MHKYAGKDGGLYDSIFDMKAADTRYEQMERLIKAQQNNSNNSNNTYYSDTDYSWVADLSIVQFLMHLILLYYPYILSYFIVSYLLEKSIPLMLLCLAGVWITYFPILFRITSKSLK